MPHPILCIFSGYITFSLPQSFQISSHIFRLCSLSISLHFILSSHFSLSFFCPINTLLLSSHFLCQSLSLSFILHPCLCVTPPHLPVSMTCFELQLVLLADDDSQTVSSVYQNYIFWAQCIQAVERFFSSLLCVAILPTHQEVTDSETELKTSSAGTVITTDYSQLGADKHRVFC